MERVHDILSDVASLVDSPAFREEQEAFYRKYCAEFSAGDDSTENKLSYTSIHNTYVEMVERMSKRLHFIYLFAPTAFVAHARVRTLHAVASHVGQPALEEVMAGLPEYVRSADGQGRSESVARTLDLLSSMSDFEEFKTAMMHKREELEGGGGGAGLSEAARTVVDLDGSLEYCAQLVEAANVADGWRLVTETPSMTAWVKPGRGKDTFMRMVVPLDLPMEQAVEMLTNLGPESLVWRENFGSTELVHDYGPDDRVYKVGVKMPWVIKYIMSVPETMAMRVVLRHDFPNVGCISYVVVPFDIERHVALEEMGPLKIKSGVISEVEGEPNKCRIASLDMANLSMMPSWGLSLLLKSIVAKQIGKMTTLFKASEHARLKYGS